MVVDGGAWGARRIKRRIEKDEGVGQGTALLGHNYNHQALNTHALHLHAHLTQAYSTRRRAELLPFTTGLWVKRDHRSATFSSSSVQRHHHMATAPLLLLLCLSLIAQHSTHAFLLPRLSSSLSSSSSSSLQSSTSPSLPSSSSSPLHRHARLSTSLAAGPTEGAPTAIPILASSDDVVFEGPISTEDTERFICDISIPEPFAAELEETNLVKIVKLGCKDEEVNWLAWKCLGSLERGGRGRREGGMAIRGREAASPLCSRGVSKVFVCAHSLCKQLSLFRYTHSSFSFSFLFLSTPGYRYVPTEGRWDNSKVYPKWRARYPEPPDLVGVTRIYEK